MAIKAKAPATKKSTATPSKKNTTPGAPAQGTTDGITTTTTIVPHSTTTTPTTTVTTAGFGPFSLETFTLVNPKTHKESSVPVDYRLALGNAILQKTIMGASTLTLQLNDPNRQLIKNIVAQGTTLTIKEGTKNLRFTLVQFVKASDQIQLIFESETIYRLRNQRGVIATTTGTGVTPFMHGLVTALNKGKKTTDPTYIGFKAVDYATTWSKLAGNSKKPIVQIGLGRGTTTDPAEDSWTAMTRIASGVGWRLWENENTIYFGPDEYWLGLLTEKKVGGKNVAVPPINLMKGANAPVQILQEWSDTGVQLIDYDWDVGKPYAQATVTALLDNWQYNLGEIVHVSNLGPGSGYWMVSGMQRDMFLPQATITLQVPMPFASVYDPTSAPLPGFPLTAATIL
jgi:hypothetical protein